MFQWWFDGLFKAAEEDIALKILERETQREKEKEKQKLSVVCCLLLHCTAEQNKYAFYYCHSMTPFDSSNDQLTQNVFHITITNFFSFASFFQHSIIFVTSFELRVGYSIPNSKYSISIHLHTHIIRILVYTDGRICWTIKTEDDIFVFYFSNFFFRRFS